MIRYVHTYTLGGSSIITNASGTPFEDYYPYGSTRVTQQFGTYNEAKQYIGLARYMDGSKGQFLSEDPIFLGDPRQQTLTDPQDLNSYSYANDNPITKSDPNGRFSIVTSSAPR
jgi:RHS repeat-associated protein